MPYCFGKNYKNYRELKKAVRNTILEKIEEGNIAYDGYDSDEPLFPKFYSNGTVKPSKTKSFIEKDCKDDLERVDEILKDVIKHSSLGEWFFTNGKEGDQMRQIDAMEIKSHISCKETCGVWIYVKIFYAFSSAPIVVIHMNDNK